MTRIILLVLTFCSFILSGSANVSRCYNCNSAYCGDPYDVVLASSISCADVYKNAKTFFGKNVAITNSAALKEQNDTQVGINNYKDVERIGDRDVNDVIRQRSHAEFFDIQRKIWEFFNKGEIDEYTQFVCVKANYQTDSGQTKTYRGCVPKSTRTISTACEFVRQKVVGSTGSSVNGCYACYNDLCNSGITFRSSLLVLLVGVALKVVF